MRFARFALPALALALVMAPAGCILTSGQITISFNLDNPINVNSASNLSDQDIALGDNGDYQDHKDELAGLADLAVLGSIKNNPGSGPVQVEIWMTPNLTDHTTLGALQADASRVKLWGPFLLAANEQKLIDWNASAGLFDAAGKSALVDEVRGTNGGDGNFTLYLIGATGTYSFLVEGAVLVLTLDYGI